MIWFDHNRIPLGRWPFMNTVRAGLSEIELALEPQLDLTEGNGEVLISGCMRAYRQAIMRRVLDLSQSAVASWNAGFPIGAIVCARSLLETIATFHSLLKRAECAAADKDWPLVGRLVDAYAFSTASGPDKKIKTDDSPPPIGKIVKEFLRDTQPGSENFWDQICDTAHPNGKRMLDYSGALTNKSYIARNAADNEPTLFVAVFNALHSSSWLIAADLDFDILLEIIRNGGELPADHQLILDRNQIDQVSAQVTKELGPMRAGPVDKKE